MDVGHFGLAGVVEYINFGADRIQFQQGTFGKTGKGVLPEVEFQHAGEVLPGGQVRGDVVVANGGIADDGAGGFDGAELGVVFFAVVQEEPHQQGSDGESQRIESPENVPIHFNHNPFFR